MKLYTLEYDCNLPVTQQVNVATNTDAKIGIKVQKNGEYLELDGSTLSVKVGNEIVFDPITLDGTSVELTGTTTNTPVTLSTDVADSDYYGYNVAAEKIKVQVSYDGTTWEDATPLTSDIVGYWYDLTVDSRRPKALINMADPQIFNVIFGPDTGKHLTELVWTKNTRIQMNAKTENWDITSYPCHFRICADFQKPNYQEMLSADAELTNDYVTFPISTPDTASYVQDTVVVNKEHAFDDTVVQSGQFPSQADPTKLNPGIFQLKASDIGAVGAVVTADQIGKTALKQWRSSNPLPEEISAWNDSTWLVYDQWMGGWIEDVVIVEGHFDGTTFVGKEIYCRPKDDDPTKLEFAEKVPGTRPAQWINKSDTYTLTKDTIFVRALSFSGNYYYGQAIPFVLGGPTKATFKLNVNTFKSQQGDKDYIGELPYIPSKTITIAGTYTDNTPFSYDVYYKD